MIYRKRSRTISLSLPTDSLTSQFLESLGKLTTSVKTEYLRQEILSKFVSDDTDPALTRRTRAINKWLATERDNEATSDRLLTTPGEYNILPRVRYDTFVEWCRDFIVGLIGETPPIEALIGSFSGGASTSRNRTRSHPASKYVGEAHATLPAFELFCSFAAEEFPLWINAQNSPVIRIVPGNVLFTVPKKTDIDRVAAKEPDLNMFMQKGIGSYFRKALRRAGINLNDQSNNRSLAQIGSRDGSLATLDLSSASDSVSTELVYTLLPEVWYTLLDTVRSPITVIDGHEHRNQMFSSMGNGFTFELESLIFFTLARATAYFRGVPGVVSVYGDDIICPTDLSNYLVWVLSYFGFQVNPDKSFTSGPFRESCGGHFHNGNDITPFYIKEPIRTLDALIDLANKLRWWGTWDGTAYMDDEVRPIWEWLASFVPRCLWGGSDHTFKYQLWSEDFPSMRIAEESTRSRTGIGGYLMWHNATWDRTVSSDGVSTSLKTKGINEYRLKPVRQHLANGYRHVVPCYKALYGIPKR